MLQTHWYRFYAFTILSVDTMTNENLLHVISTMHILCCYIMNYYLNLNYKSQIVIKRRYKLCGKMVSSYVEVSHRPETTLTPLNGFDLHSGWKTYG